MNADEIKNTAWVSRSGIDSFLSERQSKYGEGITPWFKLLKERKLEAWWSDLEDKDLFPDQADTLEKFY